MKTKVKQSTLRGLKIALSRKAKELGAGLTIENVNEQARTLKINVTGNNLNTNTVLLTSIVYINGWAIEDQ